MVQCGDSRDVGAEVAVERSNVEELENVAADTKENSLMWSFLPC